MDTNDPAYGIVRSCRIFRISSSNSNDSLYIHTHVTPVSISVSMYLSIESALILHSDGILGRVGRLDLG